MARYHINKHGVPAVCRAKPGNCPLGDENRHFSSAEEAQRHADTEAEREHGMLPGMREHLQKEESKGVANRIPISRDVRGKDLDNLVGKDVRIAGMEERNDGPIYSVDQSNGKRIVKMGTVDGVKEIDLDDQEKKVMFINASREDYSNPDYQNAMRDINRPRHEFRFNEKNIKAFEDKYVKVNYDGKEFEGKVIGTSYIEEDNNGIIIQSEDGQVKHIKSYRMTNLKIVGDDEDDFNNYKKVKRFRDEVAQDIKNFE